MKKTLSIILALVLALSLSVTAFAAETNNGTQDTKITVNGTLRSAPFTEDKTPVKQPRILLFQLGNVFFR